MVSEQLDFSKTYDFIFKIDKRITALEQDTTFIEKKITTIDKDGIMKYLEISSGISELSIALSNIKKNLRKQSTEMVGLSRELKNVVKKDQVEQLTESVDNIKFNEFVTKSDLTKGV